MTPKVYIYQYKGKDISQFFQRILENPLIDGSDLISIPGMAHTCARFFDESSLWAVIKACRAGVLGRGSLGRFHVLFVCEGTSMIVPLFVSGQIGWVPNDSVVMGTFSLLGFKPRQ